MEDRQPPETTLVARRQEALLAAARTGINDEERRRGAAAALLDALQVELEQLDGQVDDDVVPLSGATRHLGELGVWFRPAIAALLETIGPGDPQVRDKLLDLVVTLHGRQCRLLILDVLPSFAPVETPPGVYQHCEDDDGGKRMMQVLRNVLVQDPTLLLPILGCLAALPGTITAEGQWVEEVLRLALASLSTAPDSSLPALVQTVLQYAATCSEIEAYNVIGSLKAELGRRQWKGRQRGQHHDDSDTDGHRRSLRDLRDDDPLLMVAHVVVTSLASNEYHCEVVTRSYLRRIEQTPMADVSASCQLLDLMVLLMLSDNSAVAETANRIMVGWIGDNTVPFARLGQVATMVCDEMDRGGGRPSILYRRMATSLVRIANFLLLTQARMPFSANAVLSVERFILNLHKMLCSAHRSELVQSLLELSEEPIVGCSNAKSRKRRRAGTLSQQETTQHAMRTSIYAMLRQIAATDPSSVVKFKHVLIQRLLPNTDYGNGDSTQSIIDICSIMTSVILAQDEQAGAAASGIGTSELMRVLQKLLFSSATGPYGRALGDFRGVVNGLFLAAQLIVSRRLEEKAKQCIQDWVLQILLPSTRRMLDPVIGFPGLQFLQQWMKGSHGHLNEQIFQHFKMILSNTGLIQKLDQYRRGRPVGTAVLAFAELPSWDPTRDSSAQGSSRDMVFCIHFYLRRLGTSDPLNWKDTTRWVFELVNTYLSIGRDRSSSGWVPTGWLRAVIELEPIHLPILSEKLSKNQEVALGWVRRNLTTFEVNNRAPDCPESLRADMVDIWSERLDDYSLRQLLASTCQYGLALSAAVALSSAVLKNAFGHYEQFSNRSAELLRLIQFQLLKLYNLRSKSRIVVDLLSSVRTALKRRKDSNPSRRATQDEEYVPLLADLDSAASQILKIDCTHFRCFDFIDTNALWTCLCGVSQDERRFEDWLHTLADNNQWEDEHFEISFDVILYKTMILHHLYDLFQSSKTETESSATRERFICCHRSMCAIVKLLPKLRKHAGAGRDQSEWTSFVRAVVVAATAYLRLLSAATRRTLHPVDPTKEPRYSLSLCLDWCLEVLKSDCNKSALDFCEKSGMEHVFTHFVELLKASECASVVHYLLDLMSMMTFHNKALLGRMTEVSWTCFHTIYVDSEPGGVHQPSQAEIDILIFQASSRSAAASRSILKRMINTMVDRNDVQSDMFPLIRQGLMRHWGLVNSSAANQVLFFHHLVSLVKQLELLLDALNHSVNGGKGNKKEGGRSKTKQFLPVIASMNAATYPFFMEMVSWLIVCSIAVTEPCVDVSLSTPQTELGPYHHMGALFDLFARLIHMYMSNSFLFPRKTEAALFQTCRDALLVTVSQINGCVTWRNAQPLLSTAQRRVGQCDAGSIQYLGRILDSATVHVVGAVLALCAHWQAQSENPFLRSKCGSLRLAAETASRQIKDVAATHYLVLVSPDPAGLTKAECRAGRPPLVEECQRVQGFHIAKYTHQEHVHGNFDSTRPAVDARELELAETDDDAAFPICDKRIASDDDDDDDASFGVEGGCWGTRDGSTNCKLCDDDPGMAMVRKI